MKSARDNYKEFENRDICTKEAVLQSFEFENCSSKERERSCLCTVAVFQEKYFLFYKVSAPSSNEAVQA